MRKLMRAMMVQRKRRRRKQRYGSWEHLLGWLAYLSWLSWRLTLGGLCWCFGSAWMDWYSETHSSIIFLVLGYLTRLWFFWWWFKIRYGRKEITHFNVEFSRYRLSNRSGRSDRYDWMQQRHTANFSHNERQIRIHTCKKEKTRKFRYDLFSFIASHRKWLGKNTHNVIVLD